MEFGTTLSLAISVVGFVTTISTLSRKMVTKDDLKELTSKVANLSDRVVNIEKQIAVMKYQIDELRHLGG